MLMALTLKLLIHNMLDLVPLLWKPHLIKPYTSKHQPAGQGRAACSSPCPAVLLCSCRFLYICRFFCFIMHHASLSKLSHHINCRRMPEICLFLPPKHTYFLILQLPSKPFYHVIWLNRYSVFALLWLCNVIYWEQCKITHELIHFRNMYTVYRRHRLLF